MQATFTPETTSPDVIALIEAIARGSNAADGTWTLEFRLKGGRYHSAYLHRGPINAAEFASMFEWPEPPAAAST